MAQQLVRSDSVFFLAVIGGGGMEAPSQAGRLRMRGERATTGLRVVVCGIEGNSMMSPPIRGGLVVWYPLRADCARLV